MGKTWKRRRLMAQIDAVAAKVDTIIENISDTTTTTTTTTTGTTDGIGTGKTITTKKTTTTKKTKAKKVITDAS